LCFLVNELLEKLGYMKIVNIQNTKAGFKKNLTVAQSRF
jgi:hypothetical protein